MTEEQYRWVSEKKSAGTRWKDIAAEFSKKWEIITPAALRSRWERYTPRSNAMDLEPIATTLEDLASFVRGMELNAPSTSKPKSLPKKKGKDLRLPRKGREIALFDMHYPYNIDLRNVIAFVKDYRPDVLILGGDILDLPQFSRWERGLHNLLASLPPPRAMYAKAKEEIFLPIRRAIGWNAALIYLGGNHEQRVEDAIKADSKAEDWSIEANFSDIIDLYVPYADEDVPNIYEMGDAIFTHGNRHNVHHASYMAIEYGKTVRYGHTHDYQVSTKRTAAGSGSYAIIAASCGCLRSLRPSWLRGKPNNWVNGFQYGYVDDNGVLFDNIVIIQKDGRFMIGDKIYGW